MWEQKKGDHPKKKADIA
jgi:hypothetical protein